MMIRQRNKQSGCVFIDEQQGRGEVSNISRMAMLYQWQAGSTNWAVLKDMKQSCHPLKVAESEYTK
jgi:hypothetical protein